MANKALTGDQYELIAGYYADLRASLTSGSVNLYDAVYEIVKFDTFEPTIDLLQTFYNTYTVQTLALASNGPWNSVVRALNGHVLSRGEDISGNKFASLDAWMSYNSVQVDQEWADLCASAGYTVDPAYIIVVP